MEIPEVNVGGIGIPATVINDIPSVPKWLTSDPPQAISVYPPVTSQVGVPIVDMPDV